jgi:hypothetical protein
MNQNPTLAAHVQEVFDLLPLERAMAVLSPKRPNTEASRLVAKLSAPPEVLAGLWLYVDDIERAHTISQGIETPTGSYLHGIVHRREGDFSNAKYWFRRVGNHRAIAAIDYDPFAFTDDCQLDRGQNSPTLVATQRREWKALFDWCLREGGDGL